MDLRFGRRDFLKAIGAGAGAAALSSCATIGSGSAGKVVVVGAGYGGATAAKYIRMWSAGAIDVTLVEAGAEFISCPMSNLVLGGSKTLADLTVGYDNLSRRHGIKLARDTATAVDTEKRSVKLAGGTELAYDRLVLSPGVDFMWDRVPGLNNASAQAAILHAWKAGPQTLALRRQLQDMPDGGVFALTIPPMPYRCPPGPYERACLVAGYFKQSKPKSKVLLLDANPEIQSKKVLFERAFAEHYQGLIEYRPNNELKQVDAATRTAKFDFDDVKADVLNVVPPQRAAELVRSAGLVNINNRWVGVHWLTMESTAAPGIHVIGDAVFGAPLMPKSGHLANQHAKVAAAAIIQLLKGEPINPTPVMANTCYSFVTVSEAIHVCSVHQYDVAEKTFKVMPGGGLSSAANALEGRYAFSWAQNMWADMRLA